MMYIPGHTSAFTLSGIIADEMAIGMVNQKTTAVRVIPVIGKDVGRYACGIPEDFSDYRSDHCR